MLRIRTLALAALLVALTAALVPAAAHAQAPAGLVLHRLGITVTAHGAGPTEADAIAMALNEIKKDYWVLSYTVVSTLCEEMDPPGPLQPFVFCSAEVQARVIRKAFLILP